MGLDAVLHEDDYLATSENTKLPSLKVLRRSLEKLAQISRKKNARKKGSASRRKLAKKEERQHQKTARARKDFQYKTAHKLVATGFKVFFHENLNLKGLIKRNAPKQDDTGAYLPNGQSAKSGLNLSWADAAFGQFFEILRHIAAKAIPSTSMSKKNQDLTSLDLIFVSTQWVNTRASEGIKLSSNPKRKRYRLTIKNWLAS
jgi:putative transposase